MTRPILLIIIIMISAQLATSAASTSLQLPPPNADIALGVLAPIDYTRKVLVRPTNTTVQAAPSSPLILYVNNRSLSLRLDGRLIREGNNTDGRITLVDELDPGLHSIRVSERNTTISIYVLSPAEEAAEAQAQKLSVDPWRYKRVYALIASIVAIVAGYPLGIAIRSWREERRMKKEPYEELRGDRSMNRVEAANEIHPPEQEQQPTITIGRTRADLIYSIRYYLGLGVLVLVLYLLRDRIPSVRRLGLIIPAAILGVIIGIILGLRETPPRPPPIVIIQPLSQNTARIRLVRDTSALHFNEDPGSPIGTTFGSVLWLAKNVIDKGNKLIVEPSSLHRLALENPLEALAHVKSLEALAEQLDTMISKYVSLYVETRAKARVLARRYISELMTIERQAEKTAIDEIKRSLKGEER